LFYTYEQALHARADCFYNSSLIYVSLGLHYDNTGLGQ